MRNVTSVLPCSPHDWHAALYYLLRQLRLPEAACCPLAAVHLLMCSLDACSAAEDMADCVLRDGEGLHLKAWAGTEKMSRILFSENVVGSVTGYLSAERRLLASADTEAEYSSLLDHQFPHMPTSFRRLIAAAVQVALTVHRPGCRYPC